MLHRLYLILKQRANAAGPATAADACKLGRPLEHFRHRARHFQQESGRVLNTVILVQALREKTSTKMDRKKEQKNRLDVTRYYNGTEHAVQTEKKRSKDE